MHANVRLHTNPDGLLLAISTNAIDEADFLVAMADALQREIQTTLDEAEAHQVASLCGLWGILLHRALPHIVEVCCRLRGYKADVTEHRVIVAGAVVPADLVGLFPNELAEIGK